MEKFLEIISKLANTKGIIALIIVLILVFFIYQNLDFITTIEFTLNKPNEKQISSKDSSKDNNRLKTFENEEQKFAIDLKLKRIDLSPVDFNLGTYFLIEIKNEGSINTKKIIVHIDLGNSNYEEYEIKPHSYELISDKSNKNTLKISFQELLPNESAYIYMYLNNPNFKQINIVYEDDFQAADIDTINYTYEDYLNEKNNNTKDKILTEGVISFFKFILGFIIFPLAIYLVVVIITVTSNYVDRYIKNKF